MSKKLLEEVLGHTLVSQILRHRMTQQVGVDVLGYPGLGCDLLYKLLETSC